MKRIATILLAVVLSVVRPAWNELFTT